MTEFVSLTTALDGWFDTPFERLPEDLRQRVQRVSWLVLLPWDTIPAAWRREIAWQWDAQHDPANDGVGERVFTLMSEIAKYEALPPETSAIEIGVRKTMLADLRQELASLGAPNNMTPSLPSKDPGPMTPAANSNDEAQRAPPGPKSFRDQMAETLRELIDEEFPLPMAMTAYKAVLKRRKVTGNPRGWGYSTFLKVWKKVRETKIS